MGNLRFSHWPCGRVLRFFPESECNRQRWLVQLIPSQSYPYPHLRKDNGSNESLQRDATVQRTEGDDCYHQSSNPLDNTAIGEQRERNERYEDQRKTDDIRSLNGNIDRSGNDESDSYRGEERRNPDRISECEANESTQDTDQDNTRLGAGRSVPVNLEGIHTPTPNPRLNTTPV